MTERPETTEQEVREHLLNKDFRDHLTAFLIFMGRNGQPSTQEWLAYHAAYGIVEMAKLLYGASLAEAKAELEKESKRLDRLLSMVAVTQGDYYDRDRLDKMMTEEPHE